jgi:hypothetical protein
MKAVEWIDRAKAFKGWPSDYRAAKELGLSRGGMSAIRVGDTATLGDSTALEVAKALGTPPEEILVDQVAERAKDPEIKAAWLQIARRLQMGVANCTLMASIAIVLLALYSPVARAAALDLVGPSSCLYIMLTNT